MIGLPLIAETYQTLLENAHGTFFDGELTTFPRSANRILGFLSGYKSQRFHIHKVDFYSVEGASEEAKRAKPDDRDVFSIVRMDQRTDGDPLRNIHIYVNIGKSTHNELVLNHCWARFCLIKEGCQSLLFEDFCTNNNIRADYPQVRDYIDVSRLVEVIEDEPFSLHDFGNPAYSKESMFENAAEILAVGVLMGFHDLYEMQKRVKKDLDGNISRLNTLQIAKDHLVPLRYVELMLRWPNLGALCALIDESN